MANNFMFYTSYFESVQHLPKEEQKEIWFILINYAMTGDIPENMTDTQKIALGFAKPSIDKSVINAQNRKNEEKTKEKTEKITTEKSTEKSTHQDIYQNISEKIFENRQEQEQELDLFVKNKIKECVSCARPRAKLEALLKNEIFFNYFSEFRQYYGEQVTDFEEQANFVVEVLAEMIIQSNKPECFKFKKQTFNFEQLWELLQHFDEDCLRSVVSSLSFREDIKNKALYTKGAILEQAEQRKNKI